MDTQRWINHFRKTYRVPRRHIDDAPVPAMCSLILRDEAGHVAFHRARLAAVGKGAGVEGLAWQTQFWLCGYAAATMLWVNHRHCWKRSAEQARSIMAKSGSRSRRSCAGWYEIGSRSETIQWPSSGQP
jgi:hypothetical protein